MEAPAIPVDEDLRLSTLLRLGILDSDAEDRFDRLTRLAKRVFSVPLALVNFVDSDRQWTKSVAGPKSGDVPRTFSFCAHAILGHDILLLPDLQLDSRFADHPAVAGPPNFRFYAGHPLKAPDGSRLGTLCLFDYQPRSLSDEDRGLFHDLAAIVEQEVAMNYFATTDVLTGLPNRRGFEDQAQRALHLAKRNGQPVSLLFFDLNDFKRINDTYGHAEGDFALQSFAEILKSTLRVSDVFGRLGGDEFVALLADSTEHHAADFCHRLQNAVHEFNGRRVREYDISHSVGQVAFIPSKHDSVAALLLDADASMYVNKQARKKRQLA